MLMGGERGKRNPGLVSLLLAGLGLLWAGGASNGDPLLVLSPGEYLNGSRLPHTLSQRTKRTASGCTSARDCNDREACTSDVCSDGVCMNDAIAECVPCESHYICPPVDLVFVMDSSGSMRDEAAVLCAEIAEVIIDLERHGVDVRAAILGITQTPGDGFACLTDHVLGLLGGMVPGDAASCPFPGEESAYESWGPATAIVAGRFPWTPGATRLVVPISDEGPCNGSGPEGCNDPGDDRDSAENVIAVARANKVVVSPVSGSGSDACVLVLTSAVADGTGGTTMESNNLKLDLFTTIERIVLDHCEVDDRCDDQRPCTFDDHCYSGACVGTPVEDCRTCATPAACGDDDACTTDYCIDEVCLSAPNYDASTQCCDPDKGLLTVIDDGDPCTLDVCDPYFGRVSHPPAPKGTNCDDQSPCQALDECDGAGRCLGTDIEEIPCSSSADCFGLGCDLTKGFCVCGGEIPEVCLTAATGSLPQSGCFSMDEDLFVTLDLGGSARTIVGGQFLIGYDPTVLDFIDIEPGAFGDAQSPFGVELYRAINEVEGTIFYAVGIPLGTKGTLGPATLARIQFRALGECTTDELCVLSENPTNSILADDQGHRVPFTTCCTGELYIAGDGPVLTCPESVSRNVAAGRFFTEIGWDPILATSECDGTLEFECHGVNEAGIQSEPLIATGGPFPVGHFEFECTATDSCAASASCQWSVDVSDWNTVEVDVQLSAVMTSNLISRCIEFVFYGDCREEPVVVEQTLDFGGLFNFPGSAKNVALKVPAGNYGCVTARDPRHSLRSVARPLIIDGKYVVEFKGNPMLGGNWLINGNLNGDHVIDLLDNALLLAQYSANLNPNTPCETGAELHADLNGNGSVDSGDLGFIQRNFLASDKGACCSTTTSGAGASETSVISLDELDSLGLPALRSADADNDGLVTAEEILSFLGGGPLQAGATP